MNPIPRKKTEKKNSLPQVTVAKRNIMSTRKITESDQDEANGSNLQIRKAKKNNNRKVLYLEIDDEITTIYERLKSLKIKNIYIVVPKRAVLFQSIVNLKILKSKAEDLQKNIYIITNDQNGIHLATKIGLTVYDKLEGHEHPSLVSGKFLEDQQDITPLKASINTLEDETPTRRTDRKFSISDLIKGGGNAKLNILPKFLFSQKRKKSEKKKEEKGKLVLVAPNRQGLISLVIVSLIILLTITYIALPGATIALTPKSNILTVSVNVILADIDANRAELDTHPLHVIPSYVVTKKINKVITYSATGNDFKGQNASGVLTAVNTSGDDWTLVAKTRFQTDTGLVFRSQKQVVVPSARAGKNGTVDISVTADPLDIYNQPIGERGNIGPTTFFLPGLSEENQKRLYAQNKASFSGGSTIVDKKITKEDLAGAKTKMEQNLRASLQAELQASLKEKNANQKADLVLLTDNNINSQSRAIQMSEPIVNVPTNLEGQKLESFDVKGEIVASGVAYSNDDLISILKTELKLKKNPEKRLVHIDENSLTFRIIDNDPAGKKIKITATIKGIEEYEINPEKENGTRLIKKIKDHIISKKISEAETYIQNLPEIDKVKISVWPAWTPNLPGLPDNIKVEISKASI